MKELNQPKKEPKPKTKDKWKTPPPTNQKPKSPTPLQILLPLLILVQEALQAPNPIKSYQTHTNQLTGLCSRLASFPTGGELFFGGWIKTPTSSFLVANVQGFQSGFGRVLRIDPPANTQPDCRRFSKNVWLFVGAALDASTPATCGGGAACCLTFYRTLISQGKLDASACAAGDTSIAEVLGLDQGSFAEIDQDSEILGITVNNIVSTIKGLNSFYSVNQADYNDMFVMALAAGEARLHNVTSFTKMNSALFKDWLYDAGNEVQREQLYRKITKDGINIVTSDHIHMKFGSDVIDANTFCWTMSLSALFNAEAQDVIKVGDEVGFEMLFRVNPTVTAVSLKFSLSRSATNRVQFKFNLDNGAIIRTSGEGHIDTGFDLGGNIDLYMTISFCPFLDGFLGVGAVMDIIDPTSGTTGTIGKLLVADSPNEAYTEDIRPEFQLWTYSNLPFADYEPEAIYIQSIGIFNGGINTHLLVSGTNSITPEPIADSNRMPMGFSALLVSACHYGYLLDPSASVLGQSCMQQTLSGGCTRQTVVNQCSDCNIALYYNDFTFKDNNGCKLKSSGCAGPTHSLYDVNECNTCEALPYGCVCNNLQTKQGDGSCKCNAHGCKSRQ